jgi:hypothetical protein
MTVILELKDYRVETFQPADYPRDGGELHLVRKRDGAFLDLLRCAHDEAVALIWETAHGFPKEEMKAWMQEWIDRQEEKDSADDEGFFNRNRMAGLC